MRLPPTWAQPTLIPYGGFDGSATLALNTARVVAGEVSRVNRATTTWQLASPATCWAMPKCSSRWPRLPPVAGQQANAQTHYNNGIQASISMDTGRKYVHDQPGGFQHGHREGANHYPEIHQLLYERVLGTYFNHLRTGFLSLSKMVAVFKRWADTQRWLYLQDELLYNQSQCRSNCWPSSYNTDNINGVEWLWKINTIMKKQYLLLPACCC